MQKLQNPLSDKFLEATQFALSIHRVQARKGSEVPYVSHLFAVAALVMEYGGVEEQAIGALLHDVVEDFGVSVKELKSKFGDLVGQIVDDCSDAHGEPKLPWKTRKEKFLSEAGHLTPQSYLVLACDKFHNVCSSLRGLQRDGDKHWSIFRATPKQIIWYHEGLLEILKEQSAHIPASLLDDLEYQIRSLKSVVS